MKNKNYLQIVTGCNCENCEEKSNCSRSGLSMVGASPKNFREELNCNSNSHFKWQKKKVFNNVKS